METSGWRVQLEPDSRRKNVSQIMDKMKRNNPVTSYEGLFELQKMAQRFEENIYTSATSQSDYLCNIYLKTLEIEENSWRAQVQPDLRQRNVSKMRDALKRNLPITDQEGLLELQNIAQSFEESIYNTATSQSDYEMKTSLKMPIIEDEPQNTMANSITPNQVGTSRNP